MLSGGVDVLPNEALSVTGLTARRANTAQLEWPFPEPINRLTFELLVSSMSVAPGGVMVGFVGLDL